MNKQVKRNDSNTFDLHFLMREIFKFPFFIYKMGKRTVPSSFTGES